MKKILRNILLLFLMNVMALHSQTIVIPKLSDMRNSPNTDATTSLQSAGVSFDIGGIASIRFSDIKQQSSSQLNFFEPTGSAFSISIRAFKIFDNHLIELSLEATMRTMYAQIIEKNSWKFRDYLDLPQVYSYTTFPLLSFSYRYVFYNDRLWHINAGIMVSYGVNLNSGLYFGDASSKPTPNTSPLLGSSQIRNVTNTITDNATTYITETKSLIDKTITKADVHIFCFGPAIGVKYKLSSLFITSPSFTFNSSISICFDIRSYITPYSTIAYTLDYTNVITTYQMDKTTGARINQSSNIYTEKIEVKNTLVDIAFNIGLCFEFPN